MAKKRKRDAPAKNPATERWRKGWTLASQHPLLRTFAPHFHVDGVTPKAIIWNEGYGYVCQAGFIRVREAARLEPEQWQFVFAHLMLHLGLGHPAAREPQEHWAIAADMSVNRFLLGARIGRPPHPLPMATDEALDEAGWMERLQREGLRQEWLGGSMDGHRMDFPVSPPELLKATGGQVWGNRSVPRWKELFAAALKDGVRDVLEGASASTRPAQRPVSPEAHAAHRWVMDRLPLLGALAANLTIVEDAELCRRLDISIAAVDEGQGEIYLKPGLRMSAEELRFVMAHEILHVGLRHFDRREGRDPFLWNVACDYVINDWLIELEIGAAPSFGLLHDRELRGLSAESVYDRIVTDMRRMRKLATLRGKGLGDMLEPHAVEGADRRSELPTDLDAFYRECMLRGLALHEDQERGFLPGNLVEEIRSLAHPPLPWDVQLARWFEEHFQPEEKRRTYARPSRRQASTPDMPRPRWVLPHDERPASTFGVVLDTSGSMSRNLLGRALGAIASYAVAREVPRVRLIACDAEAYDEGYVEPEALGSSFKLRGRGGTVLQPGVQALEEAEDFPKDAPMLVITDGWTDVLRIKREHAFLIPKGASLPFRPKGPVFWVAPIASD